VVPDKAAAAAAPRKRPTFGNWGFDVAAWTAR
jgi:hypothetical protein